MIVEGNHIIADEGKVFRRIGTDEVFGSEIYLGYSYYICGEKLSEPYLNHPEDFEEIDKPFGFDEEEPFDE